MTASGRLVTVGRVGRAHGRDGSFWVEEGLVAGGEGPLRAGDEVVVAGGRARIERRAGTDARPLVRLSSVASRAAAAALRGESLLVSESHAPLGAGEWLVEDLVGARVEGVGEVRRVLAGPSCDLLEVGDGGVLIPLVADAVRHIDTKARRIEVDHGFLGTETEAAQAERAEARAPEAGAPRTSPAARSRP